MSNPVLQFEIVTTPFAPYVTSGPQAIINQISTYTSVPTLFSITEIQLTEESGSITTWNPSVYYSITNNLNYFYNLRRVPNENGSNSTLLLTLNLNSFIPDIVTYGSWTGVPPHAETYINLQSFCVFIDDGTGTNTNVPLAIGTLYDPYPTLAPIYKYSNANSLNVIGNSFNYLLDIYFSEFDINKVIFDIPLLPNPTFNNIDIPPLIVLPYPTVFSNSSYITSDIIHSTLITNNNINWNFYGFIPIYNLSVRATSANNLQAYTTGTTNPFSHLSYATQSGFFQTSGSNGFSIDPDQVILTVTADSTLFLTNQSFHVSNFNCNTSTIITSSTRFIPGNFYTITLFLKPQLLNQSFNYILTSSTALTASVVLPSLVENVLLNYNQIFRIKNPSNSNNDSLTFTLGALSPNNSFYFEGNLGISHSYSITPGDSVDLAVSFLAGVVEYWVV